MWWDIPCPGVTYASDLEPLSGSAIPVPAALVVLFRLCSGGDVASNAGYA